MTDKIFVPAYWPMWNDPSFMRRFDYVDPTGSMPPITSVFAYDKGSDSMLYIDYDAYLTWKDTWYYQYRIGFGIAEWRDDYHGKKVVMNPPIGWGEYADLGGSYTNKPKMDFLRSWPPAMAQGVQCVSYEKVLDRMRLDNGSVYQDILQFTYLQSWSGKPGTGARYWMARGIGPIAVQWLAQDPVNPTAKPLIETARMDAKITEVGGKSVV